MFAMTARYMPPPPPGIPPPVQWGDLAVIRERFGNAVNGIAFDTGLMMSPALSPQHFRTATEQTVGPLIKLVEMLSATDPAKLSSFRREYEALVSEYLRDNAVHQSYVMTRAKKN